MQSRASFWKMIVLSLAVVALSRPAVAKDQPAHAAVTPVPRDDAGWMSRHASFNERVKRGNVDLLMIGDSITHGWEGAGAKVWAESYAPRRAVNLGISGDRTQHVLWRLRNGNLEGISPKLAVLMIGTNNSNSESAEEIADGVEAIVDQLRAKLPETKVLILAIFPRGATPDDRRRRVNEAANKLIAPLAERDMVYFLDINEAFLDDDGTLPKDIMPDLLHPNATGYRIWAEAMEPTIADLMDENY